MCNHQGTQAEGNGEFQVVRKKQQGVKCSNWEEIEEVY